MAETALYTIDIETDAPDPSLSPRVKTVDIETDAYYPDFSPRVKLVDVETDNPFPDFSPRIKVIDIEATIVTAPGSPVIRTVDLEVASPYPPFSPRLRVIDIELSISDSEILNFITQDTQTRRSLTFLDDLLLSGAETLALNAQEDLNYLRSAIRELKGTSSFKSAPPATVQELSDRPSLQSTKILYRVQSLQDITVPPGQNWVILSNAGEPPSLPIAFLTGEGALSYQLPGSVGAHSTGVLAGEGNLLMVRTASTNKSLSEGSREVYGLLQVGSAATEGNSFALSGDDQAQISFVTRNPVTESLEPASVSVVEGQVVEYAYLARTNLSDMDEESLDTTLRLLSTPGPSLETAYAGGSTVEVDTVDVLWEVSDTLRFRITDSLGADLLNVLLSGAGDEVEASVNAVTLDTPSVELSNGLQVDTSLTLDAGQVSDSGSLALLSTAGPLVAQGSSHVTLGSTAGEVSLQDTRTALLPLSDAVNTTLYGGATSLLGAITAAGSAVVSGFTVGRVLVTTTIPADTIVTALNTTPLTDAPNGLIPYSSAAQFAAVFIIFVNGVLLHNALSGASDQEVYPAGVAANGEMAFEFELLSGDVVTILKLGA